MDEKEKELLEYIESRRKLIPDTTFDTSISWVLETGYIPDNWLSEQGFAPTVLQREMNKKTMEINIEDGK